MAVKKTPIVTTKVIATTKAMTVGTAAAIAEGFLSRMNVQFKLALASGWCNHTSVDMFSCLRRGV